MSPQELRMLAFSLLAAEARKRQQHYGELRFLLLAGSAACQAGWADIPGRCRARVLEINPHHLLAKYGSLEDALRDEEFRTFLSRLDRFCSFEMAEALLEQLHPGWQQMEFEEGENLGTFCAGLLEGPFEA